MASVNFRSFKRVYDPKAGRHRLQKWDGGRWIDSVTQITPSLINEPGKTGSGHQPGGKTGERFVKTVEEEAMDVGNAILNRLQKRSGTGVSDAKGNIEGRIKKLILGSGIQVI